MTAIAPAEPLYTVLVNGAGRHALWPARKATPDGWREALAARPRAACLAWVEESTAATATPAKPAPPTIAFGLLFFGSDEDAAPTNRYGFLIDAARFADAHGFAAVWLPERHFARMGSLYPNPAVLHAALARE